MSVEGYRHVGRMMVDYRLQSVLVEGDHLENEKNFNSGQERDFLTFDISSTC